ncbi:MAG: GatB/YqeY domain-containing protein, partial [bacterium]|nr:GatB/YqeY domain-containing protein [bacterium]
MIRDTIKSAQITAMKAGEKDRLAAVRLILAKLKDRDIELRTATTLPDDDAIVVDVLQKMVKQRRESIEMFTTGNRAELAAKEQAELDVIESFLPTQMTDD